MGSRVWELLVVYVQHRGGLRSKGLCDHPYKKNQKAPKILPKGPFLKFCMGDYKNPCDQCLTATMASPPLLVQHQRLL
jgi:hypothetical protein